MAINYLGEVFGTEVLMKGMIFSPMQLKVFAKLTPIPNCELVDPSTVSAVCTKALSLFRFFLMSLLLL